MTNMQRHKDVCMGNTLQVFNKVSSLVHAKPVVNLGKICHQNTGHYIANKRYSR